MNQTALSEHVVLVLPPVEGGQVSQGGLKNMKEKKDVKGQPRKEEEARTQEPREREEKHFMSEPCRFFLYLIFNYCKYFTRHTQAL